VESRFEVSCAIARGTLTRWSIFSFSSLLLPRRTVTPEEATLID